MFPFAIAIVGFLFPTSLGPGTERLLLDSGQELLFWNTAPGAEFPGAAVQLDTVQDSEQGRCVRARCRFGEASRYVGLEWRGTSGTARAIGFRCRLSDRQHGVIRVLDGTGQWLSGGFTAKSGEWTDVRVPLVAASFPAHWSGANDGQIHFPVRKVLIAVNRKPDQQEIRLSQLYVETERADPGEAWQVIVEPGVALGVALPGEVVEYKIHAVRRLQQPSKARLRLTGQTPNGPSREIGCWDLDAGPWQHIVRQVRLPTAKPGYLRLKAELQDKERREQASADSGLAVVPRPRYYGQWAPRCYFGMQIIPDMEVAERLGAKAARQFVFWRFTESEPEKIRWDSPSLDPVVADTRRHHMQLMITVVLMPPRWAAWKLPGNPKARELPDPARVNDYARLVGEIAARYRDHDHVTTLEIENEPNLTCMRNPGLALEPAVDYFARFLKAGYAAAKTANPRLQVASLCVSDSDFSQPLPFTKAVLDRAAGSLDLFTGHPYASPRDFGPGKRPKWPIQNLMPAKCRDALEAMAAHGRPRRMWIGELGWSLRTDTDPLGQYSLDYAACLAQSLIVAKSVPGVERYLHFTLHGCNEKGYEYGLTRGDPAYPLPAALAYAAAAQTLEDARPIELVQVGGKVWRASFAAEGRNELVVAWWSEGPAVRLRLPSDAPLGEWKDSLFQPIANRQAVLVDRMPRYWVLPLSQVGQRPSPLTRVQVMEP